MSEKTSNGLLKTGVIGSVIVGLCCFTPVLTLTLGVVGLGAITGYLDYVLLPALAIFFGITLYALTRRRGAHLKESGPPEGYPPE